MTQTVSLFVSYLQIAVFVQALPNPFHDWSPRHADQGFAWRPGSIFFKTLVETGIHMVDVQSGDYTGYDPNDDAIRVIDVPIRAMDAKVELGSISDTTTANVEPGDYALRFHAYEPTYNSVAHIRFSFLRNTNPQFAILRADAGLSVRGDLLLSAKAAGSV